MNLASDLARLRYFHGRALSALDLRREQDYQLTKDRRHNRLLHGWGIVCGLGVELVPPEPCDGDERLLVRLHPGAAVDAHGEEIVVRHTCELDIAALLSDEDRKRLEAAPATVYLTLHYHEQLIDPSRPLLAAGCEPVPACEYGRVREGHRVCASTRRPERGPECEPCLGDGHGELELAAVPCLSLKGTSEPLDLRGRRPLARHDLAEISRLNWTHGATYSREGATALFAEGIEVRFSRPVQVASLRTGVVDLTVVEAGGGRAGGVYDMRGEFVGLPEDRRLTDRFVFRSTTDETLQYGDRVVVHIHGDFIVDACCRALDANHLGGAIPLLDERPADPVDAGQRPHCEPRGSGNGTEGGEFVSWVFVQDRQANDDAKGTRR